MHGVLTATAKRPIPQAAIEDMVDSIEDELSAMGRVEIKSSVVGACVLDHLKRLDPMAYIRFAMVYLQLSDLEALQEHISRMLTPA